jgi:hypothetical protein
MASFSTKLQFFVDIVVVIKSSFYWLFFLFLTHISTLRKNVLNRPKTGDFSILQIPLENIYHA